MGKRVWSIGDEINSLVPYQIPSELPQVNAMYAAKIMADTGELDDGLPSKRAKPASKSVLADERFQGMFEDPAFTIDQGAEEYKVLHPNAGMPLPRLLLQRGHLPDHQT